MCHLFGLLLFSSELLSLLATKLVVTGILPVFLPKMLMFSFLEFLLDDDMDSISSNIIGDSDVDELDQHLLPEAVVDVHSIDVSPKLSKDLL